MMTKFFVLVFGALTAAAVYTTVYDVGVQDTSFKKQSVREGSVHRGHRLGSTRRGK
ncbi:MAG: hypothetical protein R3318_02980 [Gammaproteobacteria bacterium]|nr:hypothetical protein [Gammaproteobacteria bacterium]